MKQITNISICLLLFTLIFFNSFTAHSQCGETGNPSKWLYKPFVKKIKIDYPATVTHATKLVDLNPGFGFEHSFSRICFARNEDTPFLWFLTQVKYNKRWNVNKNDLMTIYFSETDSIRLEPTTDFKGIGSGGFVPSTTVFCFYKLTMEQVDYLKNHIITKISMQMTSVPAKGETANDIPEYEAFNYPLGGGKGEKVNKIANCLSDMFKK